jgi:hypothetical protein
VGETIQPQAPDLNPHKLKQGVFLELDVPKRVRLREPAILEIVLANRTRAPFIWGDVDGYRDCYIEVYDAFENIVPVTPFGARKIGRNEFERRFKVRCRMVELAPGKRKVWKLDLAALFELPPGCYRVSASIDQLGDPWQIIHAEDFEFEVTE